MSATLFFFFYLSSNKNFVRIFVNQPLERHVGILFDSLNEILYKFKCKVYLSIHSCDRTPRDVITILRKFLFVSLIAYQRVLEGKRNLSFPRTIKKCSKGNAAGNNNRRRLFREGDDQVS